MSTFRIIHADAMNGLATLPDAGFAACFCDPPYGLSFMGKSWDHGVPGPEVWREVLRVLKPGAPLLAFGGTRTFHRLVCAIEDAGFALADTLCWLYGSGFPKGHAQLKPAWEPITLAWKKGKRALAIDAGRIPSNGESFHRPVNHTGLHEGYDRPWRHDAEALQRERGKRDASEAKAEALGRWPANVLLDDASAAMLDAQSGVSDTAARTGKRTGRNGGLQFAMAEQAEVTKEYGDIGGASRFFYIAKADSTEREIGLYGIEIVTLEYKAWDNEGCLVRLQVDTAQSVPKVIGVSGTPSKDVSEWNTFLFGNAQTAQSLQASKSITVTSRSSITGSKTLNWLTRSLINASIVVVKSEMANGGNLADSAEPSNASLNITGHLPEFPHGVKPVASGTPLTISGNAGSLANHPCVKPVDLCAYLSKLILPGEDARLIVPFSGSGSEIMGALRAGWSECVGIEKEAEYVELSRRRIIGDAPMFNSEIVPEVCNIE